MPTTELQSSKKLNDPLRNGDLCSDVQIGARPSLFVPLSPRLCGIAGCQFATSAPVMLPSRYAAGLPHHSVKVCDGESLPAATGYVQMNTDGTAHGEDLPQMITKDAKPRGSAMSCCRRMLSTPSPPRTSRHCQLKLKGFRSS